MKTTTASKTECGPCATNERNSNSLTVSGEDPPIADVALGAELTKPEQSVDDLLERLRTANRKVVRQMEKIQALESYLTCIVNLAAQVRRLELDAS